MSKGFSAVYILVGILILAAVAGGAYFLGRQTLSFRGASEMSDLPRDKTGAAILPASSPTPTVSESTGSADMANWKTYTTKGFEFRYPPNGVLTNESLNMIYISYQENTKPYWTFTANLSDNPNHLTSKQYVDKMINDLRNNKNAPWAKSQADQMQQTMKDYTNNQIIGIKLQSFDEGYPQEFGKVVEATENKIYVFNIGNGSGGGVGDEDEKLLDQILSTFKFIP